MMHWLLVLLLATAGAGTAAAAGDAAAADNAARHGAPARTLTGKERLGAKWTDEQRVDDCKVPRERRGSRVRPDDCAHVPRD